MQLCVIVYAVQFKAISQAYEVLADSKKRDLYDRGGEQAIKEGGIASEMHNPMDIFDMFFGGGGRSRSPTKGKDVIHQLKVSLEDLYNGTVRKLALQKNVICVACEGLIVLFCLFQYFIFQITSMYAQTFHDFMA